MDFLDACLKFIGVDSSPQQGSVEIAQLAAEFCENQGWHVEIQEENLAGVPQANIIARPQAGAVEGEILYQAPLDTIDPGSFGLWSLTDNNPYKATIREGSIYGLGAAHGKLDFLCKLKALSEFNTKKFKTPFVLVGTFGAEQGLSGAIRLIRRKKILSKKALVGGPSRLRALHMGKGMASVEMVVPFTEEEIKFRQQHDELELSSSQSKMFMTKASDNRQSNAILKMMDYVDQLPSGISLLNMDGGLSHKSQPTYASIEFDLVNSSTSTVVKKIRSIRHAVIKLEEQFREHQDPSFNPPFPTINIGVVRNRGDCLTFLGVCHVPPSIDQKQYEVWMNELSDACKEQGASFRITAYVAPFRTPLDSELVQVATSELEFLGLDYIPSACSISTEANVFKKFGMECLIFGAGSRGGVDQIPNEKNEIEDLRKSITFYEKFTSRLCL